MSINLKISVPLVFFIICFCFSASAEQNNTGSLPLKIVPESLSVEVGDPLIVNGYIDNSIMGPFPGTVILIIRAPMASQIDSYTTLTPNPDGTFRYSVNTDVTGTWTVSGRYGDEVATVSEVKVTPREEIKTVTNTLNSHTGPVIRGRDVTMTGYLRDSKGVGLANKEVTYMVALPPYGCSICDLDDLLIWNTYRPVLTDSAGRYTFTIGAADGGTYKVKTVFAGDETYQGSESALRTFTAG
jgi:hypothetical protein